MEPKQEFDMYMTAFDGRQSMTMSNGRVLLVIEIVWRDWLDVANCIADACVNLALPRPTSVYVYQDIDPIVRFNFTKETAKR